MIDYYYITSARRWVPWAIQRVVDVLLRDALAGTWRPSTAGCTGSTRTDPPTTASGTWVYFYAEGRQRGFLPSL